MDIIKLDVVNNEAFEQFKAVEWKKADEEHYQDNPPNFETFKQIYLAVEAEKIVGQIELKLEQGVAKIESLLVGSEQQGQGIGRQLVATAEVWARENGAHKISLETGLQWSAKVFYEKLGYEVRAVLPNDVAHQDFVLMDKML